MTEDLTNKLSRTTDDTLTLIFMAVQDLTFRAGMIEHKLEDFAGKAELRLQKVGLDIAQIQEGQRGLQERQKSLEAGQESLEQGQKSLEEGQKSLRADLTAFRRHVDQQFLKLSGTVEGRYREHDKRIARLEANANPPNTET